MCMPSFAICVSKESIVTNNVVRNIENSISNTTAVLSNGEEILELYPIRVETLTKEHEFTIGGHQYVLNTGFTHFTAPEEAYFSLGCTATATFQRGEASFWDFSVQCNYK